MEQQKLIDRTKQRETNLELFRIITMLFIIVHHYVVNSALWSVDGPITQDPMAWKSLFLLIVGAFGKIGINCFVLISGYFMCQSSISAKKYAKLYLEVVFYYFAANAPFWITGYGSFVWEDLLVSIYPAAYIGSDFVTAFLVLFFCVPFINKLLQNLSQREHVYLLLLAFVIYVIPGTFRFVFYISSNHLSWYVVLYLFAAYIRKYPNSLFENKRFWAVATVVNMGLCAVSVIICTYLEMQLQKDLAYYFVSDSNTFLALTTAISAFLYFKNLKMPYCPIINRLASTCFGVLLIHGASDDMRYWLWQDLLDNNRAYASEWMILHVILSTLGVFLTCAVIDLLRQKYVEKPFFRLWDKHWGTVAERFFAAEKSVFRKLNIEQ